MSPMLRPVTDARPGRTLCRRRPTTIRDMPVGVLSEQQLLAWRQFLRTHALVTRRLESELMAEQQLPLASYDVLVQLVEAPQRRLRMSELAEDLCDGEWAPLLLAFTQQEKLSAEELGELQRLIDDLSSRRVRNKKKQR